MDPVTGIAAFSAAVSLVKALAPQVEEWVKSGQISVEDQAKLKAESNALRNHLAFTGPEWEQG